MNLQGREDHYKVGGLKNLTKTSKYACFCVLIGHGALKSQPKQKKKGGLV